MRAREPAMAVARVDVRVAGAAPPRLADMLLYLWRLSRPETWMVSFLPMYVGFVLASREIAPGFALWSGFWAQAATHGATTAEFAATLGAWWAHAWRPLAAAVVMGPLAWLATLLINDVHDLESDRANPRKARSPLVQGLVTRGWAHASAYAAAAAEHDGRRRGRRRLRGRRGHGRRRLWRRRIRPWRAPLVASAHRRHGV